MQTTAIRTVVYSLLENDVNFLTLLISMRNIPYTDLQINLDSRISHIRKNKRLITKTLKGDFLQTLEYVKVRKFLSVRKKVIPLRGFEKTGDIYNRVMGTWIWLRTPGHRPMFE